MRLAIGLVSWILLGLLCGPRAGAAGLTALETDDLRLIYVDPQQTYLAPHVARCFENSLQFHRQLWDYEPSERMTVFLSDLSDRGNANASSVPRNRLILETAPLSFAYETVAPNERMNWLMNHELVHITATDKANKTDLAFRKFFRGKVLPTSEHPESILYFYLTSPRNAAPSWYQEGIAVFIETWMAGGLGRAQGAYDEMVFRAKVRDDSLFYDPLGLESEGTRIDFQVGVNSYLYGTRFMSYLAHEYGPQSLIDWVGRTDGSRRYYAAQFKRVYGLPLTEAWQHWIDFEREFQQTNLDAVRQYPVTPVEDVSVRALGSISRTFVDRDRKKLYGAFNYPGVVAHIGSIDLADGQVRKLVDVKGPALFVVTALAYDAEHDMLYYTTDNSNQRDLRSLDPTTGKSKMLMKDLRVGDLVFDAADRSIWGIRHFNGIATLVRIPAPYDDWEQIHSWSYGDVPYDIDVSPDGRLLSASVGEISGRHSLQVFSIDELAEGGLQPLHVVDFGSSIPSNFVFSPDGRFLYGSSYYTGVSNIFRYELASEALEAVSNTETGLFRPLPLGDDKLIVFRYTGEGFVPATMEATPLEDVSAIVFLGQQLVEEHPILADWVVGSPAAIPLDSMITRQGDYQSFKSVGLESIYPVVEGYKDYAAYGFRLALSDPLSLNRGSVVASYTPNSGLPDNEKLHLQLEYQRKAWTTHFRLNDADFYDLFGPTKTSRKGHSLGLDYHKTLIYDDPRRLEVDWNATYYGGFDRLPRYQNVAATFDELAELSGSLTYRNLRSSLGAVDPEKGLRAEAHVGTSYVDSDWIPAVLGNFDVGVALPLHHSSIWWRNSVGASFGEIDDPFANFFFGGFGNNYVDHGNVKRYREWYSFPGVELNEVPGRNFAKSMVEWNLPPLRFRSAGNSAIHLTWARASLFASGLRTNLDDDTAERELANLGTQIDFRLTLLSRLRMTISLGYAVGFESGVENQDEIMFSLKIIH